MTSSISPVSVSTASSSSDAGTSSTRTKRLPLPAPVDGPRTLRSRTVATDSSTTSRKRVSTLIPRSAVVSSLPAQFRLPFSEFPLFFTFMKPLSKLKLTSQYKVVQLSDLIGNYENAIRERGYDHTVVEVAYISDTIGHGVFARKAIKAGEMIAIYSGRYILGIEGMCDSKAYVYDLLEGIDSKECPMVNTSAKKKLEQAAQSSFGVDHVKPDEGYDLGVDAIDVGNFTRYFNDGGPSSNLQAEICIINGKLELVISATKDIKAGNQLLISYGAQYWRAFAVNHEKKHESLTPTRYVLELHEELSPTSSSSSSSSSAPLTDDVIPPFLLHHQQRLRELNAQPGDITLECLKEAQALLRPSAVKGAEKIAFCYLNLACLRPNLKTHPLHIQELVKLIPVQRYEMEMTLLHLKDALSFQPYAEREHLNCFFELENKLHMGELSYHEIESLLEEYKQLQLNLVESPIRISVTLRLIELNMHLSEYHSDKRLAYLKDAEKLVASFFLMHLSQMPFTMRLAYTYSSQISRQINESPSELLPITSTARPSTSTKKRNQRLEQFSISAYRENIQFSKCSARKHKSAFSFLDPHLPRGLKQHAFQIADWASLESGSSPLPLRLQHYEIKSELLKLRLHTTKTSEESQLLALEDRLKQGQLRPAECKELRTEYQKLVQSDSDSIKAIALFRLAELSWIYSESADEKFVARSHFLMLKALLEERPSLLPHTAKIADYYLNLA